MLNPRIKLHHLRCLIAVARHGTIVAAAAELGMAQPAVSKTLQELERVLGARLLSRSRRGTELTAAGGIFLRHAEAAVAALTEGADRVTGNIPIRPLIRVGALPTVSALVMPEATRRFLAAHPGTPLRIVDGATETLIAQLRTGALDLVVGRMAEGDMTGLTFEHLYSERIALVVRPGHPLAGRRRPAAADLLDFPVIVPPEGSVIRPTADRFIKSLGIWDIPHRLETVSPSFGRAFVAASDAVWFISQGVVRRDVEAGDLAELAFDMGDTSGPVGLTLRVESEPEEPVQALIEAIRAAAAELRPAPDKPARRRRELMGS